MGNFREAAGVLPAVGLSHVMRKVCGVGGVGGVRGVWGEQGGRQEASAGVGGERGAGLGKGGCCTEERGGG